MDDDARLDAIEAWTVRAQALMDGIKVELRVDGRSAQLRDRALALRAELDVQARALEEMAEDSED